jgi:hypothetical protein
MQRKLDEYERARFEPIAIIRLGCRFPGGVVDAETYWEVLRTGTDALREVPADPSPDGRCKTFDAAADGSIPSEGCGFVVLKGQQQGRCGDQPRRPVLPRGRPTGPIRLRPDPTGGVPRWTDRCS